MTYTAQLVEISGHLIDSLTLSKVIDKIQQAQCHYQITEIQIGSEKQDLSFARIALMANEQAQLEALLESLTPYGIKAMDYSQVRLAVVEQAGQAPEDCYLLPLNQLHVCLQNRWVHVDDHPIQLAVLVDEFAQAARLTVVDDLQVGDHVVVGEDGTKLIPCYHHE